MKNMKKRMKEWLIKPHPFISNVYVAFFFVASVVVMLILFVDHPEMAQAYMAVGTSILLPLATLILVGVTWMIVKSSNEREKRDREERLLNDIIKWAEDIDTASSTPDLPIGKKDRAANELMRYSASMSRAISIKTIIELRFRDELLPDFDKVYLNTLDLMCIKQYMGLDSLPDENSFPKDTIDKTKERLSKEPIKDIFNEYATAQHDSITDLLEKANRMKIELYEA